MELTLTEITRTAPRKSTLALAIVALAIAAFAAIWLVAPSPERPGPDLSRSKASGKGLYAVAIEPESGAIRLGEMHSWLLTLATPAGDPVEGATITVDGGMPEHHHGLPTSPAVTAELGSGKYRVEGMKFTMSGWWELRFAISAPAGEDSVTFNLQL